MKQEGNSGRVEVDQQPTGDMTMKKLFNDALTELGQDSVISAKDVAKKMAELAGNDCTVFEFVEYAEMALAAKWGTAW